MLTQCAVRIVAGDLGFVEVDPLEDDEWILYYSDSCPPLETVLQLKYYQVGPKRVFHGSTHARTYTRIHTRMPHTLLMRLLERIA